MTSLAVQFQIPHVPYEITWPRISFRLAVQRGTEMVNFQLFIEFKNTKYLLLRKRCVSATIWMFYRSFGLAFDTEYSISAAQILHSGKDHLIIYPKQKKREKEIIQ